MKIVKELDVKDLLIIVKGISKKTGKAYAKLDIGRQYIFDSNVIALLEKEDVRVLDFTSTVK